MLRKLTLLFCFLLSLPASMMAQSCSGRFEIAALRLRLTAPTTSTGQAIQENPFAQDCEVIQTPVQFFSAIPSIGFHLRPICSLGLPFTNPFPQYRCARPSSGMLVLNQQTCLMTDQYRDPVLGSTGFTHVAQLPTTNVPGSRRLLQSRLCQIPEFKLPRAPAGAPPGDAGEPLTTPKLLVRDVLHDEESIWKFPWEVAHGHHWKPALAFTLATAGLVELDPHDTPYFRRTNTFSGFNQAFSSLNTGLGEGLFPVGFFLAGHVRKDAYMERTALLAGEALADAEIVSEVMKNVDRRLRPRQIPPYGDFAHTWFKAGGGILINRGSFPSGHAIGAFSMATIIAERYRRHRWVPWVAYGLAALVGFSRITLQAHFPSDIFAGAVLGYAISHYVVLRNQ